MAELQKEAQEARAEADSMVLASDKLSQELVKVHEEYDEATRRKRSEKDVLARDMDEPAPEDVSDGWEVVQTREAQSVKTHDTERPCLLNLEVWNERQSGKFQLRARDGGGIETRITLSDDLIQGLDASSPWVDLFSRVGVSADPQDPTSRVVISEFLGQRNTSFTPNEVARGTDFTPNEVGVLCRVHRFDTWRYYITGTSLETSFMSDYVITKDDLSSDADLSSAIHMGVDGNELIDLFLEKLSFDDGGDGFYFRT